MTGTECFDDEEELVKFLIDPIVNYHVQILSEYFRYIDFQSLSMNALFQNQTFYTMFIDSVQIVVFFIHAYTDITISEIQTQISKVEAHSNELFCLYLSLLNFTPMYDGTPDYTKFFYCNLDLEHFSLDEINQVITQSSFNVNERVKLIKDLYAIEPNKQPLSNHVMKFVGDDFVEPVVLLFDFHDHMKKVEQQHNQLYMPPRVLKKTSNDILRHFDREAVINVAQFVLDEYIQNRFGFDLGFMACRLFYNLDVDLSQCTFVDIELYLFNKQKEEAAPQIQINKKDKLQQLKQRYKTQNIGSQLEIDKVRVNPQYNTEAVSTCPYCDRKIESSFVIPSLEHKVCDTWYTTFCTHRYHPWCLMRCMQDNINECLCCYFSYNHAIKFGKPSTAEDVFDRKIKLIDQLLTLSRQQPQLRNLIQQEINYVQQLQTLSQTYNQSGRLVPIFSCILQNRFETTNKVYEELQKLVNPEPLNLIRFAFPKTSFELLLSVKH